MLELYIHLKQELDKKKNCYILSYMKMLNYFLVEHKGEFFKSLHHISVH